MALGRALALEILKELRPATSDSTICRAAVRIDSVGRAIVAGFVAEVQPEAHAGWTLSVRDFRTPLRGWTVREIQWRGDSAVATVLESASSLEVGGPFEDDEMLYAFVRDARRAWRARPHQGKYFSDGVITGGRSRCRPFQ